MCAVSGHLPQRAQKPATREVLIQAGWLGGGGVLMLRTLAAAHVQAAPQSRAVCRRARRVSLAVNRFLASRRSPNRARISRCGLPLCLRVALFHNSLVPPR